MLISDQILRDTGACVTLRIMRCGTACPADRALAIRPRPGGPTEVEEIATFAVAHPTNISPRQRPPEISRVIRNWKRLLPNLLR
jgi:hypothetical protein